MVVSVGCGQVFIECPQAVLGHLGQLPVAVSLSSHSPLCQSSWCGLNYPLFEYLIDAQLSQVYNSHVKSNLYHLWH